MGPVWDSRFQSPPRAGLPVRSVEAATSAPVSTASRLTHAPPAGRERLQAERRRGEQGPVLEVVEPGAKGFAALAAAPGRPWPAPGDQMAPESSRHAIRAFLQIVPLPKEKSFQLTNGHAGVVNGD